MAITTLCPQCKAICSIPDAAVGKQVACSRCEAVFAADPFLPPTKLRTKKSIPQRMGALVIFLILLGASGTLAIVAASIVFVFYQFHVAMRPSEWPAPFEVRGGGGGFAMVPPGPDLNAEEKNPPTQKVGLPSLELAPTPPEFVMPVAVQKAVNLNRHPSIAEYAVTLQSWLQGQEQSPAGSNAQLKSRTAAEFIETVQAVDPTQQASIRLRYRGYQADGSRDGVSRTMPLAANSDLASANAFLLLNDKGEPTAHRLDVSRLPAGADGAVKKVHEIQRVLFEFFAIPLPNQTAAKPGATWTYQKVVPFQFSDDEETTRIFEAKATLRGAQQVGAADYALVEMRGKLLNPKKGEAEDPTAKAGKGWALVDASTGIIMQADAEIPFAFALAAEAGSRPITGNLRLSMQRRIPPVADDNNQ
jgi:hypothetical protein